MYYKLKGKGSKIPLNFGLLFDYALAVKMKLFLPLPLLISPNLPLNWMEIPKLTQFNPNFKKRPIPHFKPNARPIQIYPSIGWKTQIN